MKAWLMVSGLLAISLTSTGQGTPGAWLMYWGTHQVGKQWEVYSEWQMRQKNLVADHEQVLLRAGVGRKINKHVSLGSGYGSISYYNNSSDLVRPDAMEQRWWGQMVHQRRDKSNILEHRLRTEHRWHENVPDWRWRYRIMWIHPIHMFNEDDDALVVHLSNELFVHQGASWFDRNRLFAAIGYHCNTHCEIQAGYLVQNAYRQKAGNYIQLGFWIH